MIKVYRLTKERFKDSAMDGEGAAKYGGRWNSPGKRIVYASDSRALAMLETLVNLEDEKTLLESYVIFEISIPHNLIQALKTDLPDGWRENPPTMVSRAIGDSWISSGSSVALVVPSAVIPAEQNFLVNPTHPDFKEILVEGPFDIELDHRLIDP